MAVRIGHGCTRRWVLSQTDIGIASAVSGRYCRAVTLGQRKGKGVFIGCPMGVDEWTGVSGLTPVASSDQGTVRRHVDSGYCR